MIYGVIMAGGKGERFWPASRRSKPKQVLTMFGNKSLLQLTINRMSKLVSEDRILVVSNSAQEKAIKKECCLLPSENILLEPIGKNTAPCIVWAATWIEHYDPEGVMVVVPADQSIGNEEMFVEVLKFCTSTALKEDVLITLGISPTRPESGYGYIHRGKLFGEDDKHRLFNVEGFKEKPSIEIAGDYLESGDYLWNSGMFIWSVKAILEATKSFMPDLYKSSRELKDTIGTSQEKEAFVKFYEQAEKVSIDYGIMEKAQNVLVAEASFGWDDLGSWSSLERHMQKDENGNTVRGEAHLEECRNCLVVSDEGIVTLLGLENIIVVRDSNAVLVLDKKKDQEVRKILQGLRKRSDAHYYE
ncbi:MAG: mannose-1-phosphate guanylyltransferase [Candidatus Theseobacter exili]|nr:mannose-1-phosphate guanylyltransferase [Candidatus Theseobacter exili]